MRGGRVLKFGRRCIQIAAVNGICSQSLCKKNGLKPVNKLRRHADSVEKFALNRSKLYIVVKYFDGERTLLDLPVCPGIVLIINIMGKLTDFHPP